MEQKWESNTMVACPSCGYFEEFTRTYTEGINVFSWKCPKCGTEQKVSRDMKRSPKNAPIGKFRLGKA